MESSQRPSDDGLSLELFIGSHKVIKQPSTNHNGLGQSRTKVGWVGNVLLVVYRCHFSQKNLLQSVLQAEH